MATRSPAPSTPVRRSRAVGAGVGSPSSSSFSSSSSSSSSRRTRPTSAPGGRSPSPVRSKTAAPIDPLTTRSSPSERSGSPERKVLVTAESLARLSTPTKKKVVGVSALYDDVQNCTFQPVLLSVSPTGGDSKSSIARLTTPSRNYAKEASVVSAVIDDQKNCTFKPEISPSAKSLSLPDFIERVPAYVKRFRDLQSQPPRPDPACTFQPTLVLSAHAEALRARDGGDFLDRMQADVSERIVRAEIAPQKQWEEFHASKPKPPTSPKRSRAPTTTVVEVKSFDERLQRDIELRDENKLKRDMRSTFEPECTFKPQINSKSLHLSSSPGAGGDEASPSWSARVQLQNRLIARMAHDVDTRAANIEWLRRQLSKDMGGSRPDGRRRSMKGSSSMQSLRAYRGGGTSGRSAEV